MMPWKVKKDSRKNYTVYWIVSIAIKLVILALVIVFLFKFYKLVR